MGFEGGAEGIGAGAGVFGGEEEVGAVPAGGKTDDVVELGIGGWRLNESRAIEVCDEGFGFGDQRLFRPAVEFAFWRYVGVDPYPLAAHSDEVAAEKQRGEVGCEWSLFIR